jgi:hypothetical protein
VTYVRAPGTLGLLGAVGRAVPVADVITILIGLSRWRVSVRWSCELVRAYVDDGEKQEKRNRDTGRL